eukprot:g200.t1
MAKSPQTKLSSSVASSFLPKLPFLGLPDPEEERINLHSLASVKRALKRRGLPLYSVGMKGEERLKHLRDRLQLALDREREAESEATLVAELEALKVPIVTPGLVTTERNEELARRLYEARERIRIRGEAQLRVKTWNRIAGGTATERLKRFKRYNTENYTKLMSQSLACCDYTEIERLCTLGADSNAETKAGHTALNQAATFNKCAFAKTMVERFGADPNRENVHGVTPLILASSFGHVKVISVLAKLGADVNKEGSCRKTPLIAAAVEGRIGSIQRLISLGAEIDTANADGHTALIAACSTANPQIEAAAELLSAGADLFLRDSDDRDAYLNAKLSRNHGVAAFLRKEIIKRDSLAFSKGAKKSYQDEDVFTKIRKQMLSARGKPQASAKRRPKRPAVRLSSSLVGLEKVLHNAIVGNDYQTIFSLVRSIGGGPPRMDVNFESASTRSETALMRAAWFGAIEPMELLLAIGADPNHVSTFGKQRTALHLAAENGQQQAILILLKWGADINAQDEEQNTPLMLASRGGHPEAVSALVQHGAFVNSKNMYGSSAFTLAAAHRRAGVASLLMSRDVYMADLEDSLEDLADVNTKVRADAGRGRHDDIKELIARRPRPTEEVITMKDSIRSGTIPSIPLAQRKHRSLEVELAPDISNIVNATLIADIREKEREEEKIQKYAKRGRRSDVLIAGTVIDGMVPEDTESSSSSSSLSLASKQPRAEDNEPSSRQGGRGLKPTSFKWSIGLIDGFVDGLQARLFRLRRKARAAAAAKAAEDAKNPDYQRMMRRKRMNVTEDEPEYFADPAELKLAAFYISHGDFEKAAEMCNLALEMQSKRYDEDAMPIALSLNQFGAMFDAMGRFDAAEEMQRRALALLERDLGPVFAPCDERTVVTVHLLLDTLVHALNFDAALTLCDEVEKQRRKTLSRHDDLVKDIANRRSSILEAIEETKRKEKERKRKHAEDERKRKEEKKMKRKEMEESMKLDPLTRKLIKEEKDALKLSSFLRFLKDDPVFVEVFTKFAKYDGAENDLRFFFEVEEFRKLKKQTREIHDKIQYIFRRFIRSTCLPVLTHDLKLKIEKNMQNLNKDPSGKDELEPLRPQDLFNDAQLLVLGQLHTGTQRRFVDSKWGARFFRGRFAEEHHWNGLVRAQAWGRMLYQLSKLPSRAARARKVSEALESTYEQVIRRKRMRSGAAGAIQSIFRGHVGRKRACKASLQRLVQLYDDSAQAYFYKDMFTGETVPSPPTFWLLLQNKFPSIQNEERAR